MTMAPPPLPLCGVPPRPRKPYLTTEASHVAVYRTHGTVVIGLRRGIAESSGQAFVELERESVMALIGRLVECVGLNDLEMEKEKA